VVRVRAILGCKDPCATTKKLHSSRLRFATRRFSVEFSCSSSFSRFAWCATLTIQLVQKIGQAT
jgi:hypothetical protein